MLVIFQQNICICIQFSYIYNGGYNKTMETAETTNYTLFFDDGIGLIDVAKKLLRYIPKKFVINFKIWIYK